MAASPSELAAELRRRIQRELDRRRAGEDPVAFARLCGMEPDPWQRTALAGTHRLLLNCCRQSGKSTTAAAVALHRALYRPGSLVLLISPSLRQSGELLRKVSAHIRGLGGVKLRNRSALTLEFDNGSRIVSLPASEDTIRGFSAVSLIIEDEAADVPDELHDAVRPMLAVSNGDLMLMGTPKGKKGHFYEAWASRGTWDRISVEAHQCPRIDQAWLASEREALYKRGLGEFYRQEYECAFVDGAAGRVYRGFLEERNVIDELPPAAVVAPWSYGLGIDFGIVNDNALTVAAWRAHDPVTYILRSYPLHGGVREVGEEVLRLDEEYRFDRIVGDTGGMGKAFADDMIRYRRVPVREARKTDKLGHIALFNGDMADGNVKLLRRGTEALRDEWSKLVWAEGGQKEAPGANHCADATLYIWYASPAYGERTVSPARALTREQEIQEFTKDAWAETEKQIAEAKREQREMEGWE